MMSHSFAIKLHQIRFSAARCTGIIDYYDDVDKRHRYLHLPPHCEIESRNHIS